MRQTIYLGDTLRRRRGQATRFERHWGTEPEGEEMAVFDRSRIGGLGEYQRPWSYEEDHVSRYKITRGQMKYRTRRD